MMDGFTRYAIYYLPNGALADFGAHWLGWDVDAGQEANAPEGSARWTQTPRKYGFHGTLKPPFRLADGAEFENLHNAASTLAQTQSTVSLEGLELTRLGSFYALIPTGDTSLLSGLAAACIKELDALRAPARPEELEKRRGKGLSPRQDALLMQWGYPYVLDEFRFHLTLTGRVPASERTEVEAMINAHLPKLPHPFAINEIALVGERSDGRFQTIQRFALQGA